MAGLLSSLGRSAWGVIDPLVPDEQIMGLLGRMRGPAPVSDFQWNPAMRLGNIHGTGQAPPAGAPVVPDQRQEAPRKPVLGGAARIPGALFGAILNDLESGPRKSRMQDEMYAELQKRHQEIDATIQDPRERLTAHANLEEWSKNNATRYGAHNVAGGNALVMGEPGRPGSSIYNAPKYGESEGRGYSVTPEGIASLGELPETYDMRTDRMRAETDASGYTLGPGMTRYGRNNEVLAAAPFAPQYREVGPGESLVAVGGERAEATPSYQQVAAAITSAIPGARVTSGLRTPEDNARVDGVPNSQHLSGTALDLVPPPGVGMGEFAQQLRATVPPGTEIIPEGDHVHIEWGGRGGGNRGGAQVVAQGAPKPTVRAATAQEKAAYGIPANVPAQIGPDGKIDVINVGTQAGAGGQPTEAERTAGFLASRLSSSLRGIMGVTATNPNAEKPGLAERVVGTVFGEDGADLVRSGDRQQIIANQLDALDAALTLGTGAAYTREQLENYRRAYFPQLNDKPDVARAKQRKFLDLLKAAEIKAGRAAPPELRQIISTVEGQLGGARPGGPPQRGAPASIPAAAIQMLRQDPQLAAKFDEKYGKGAAARVLGR
jgi:hypothetical protein